MTIRPATSADVPDMICLERQCPTAAHWTDQQYQELFQSGPGGSGRLVLVAEGALPANPASGHNASKPSAVLGVLVAHNVASEWELENIVVTPAARNQGLGKKLLERLLTAARETNSDSVFLEVRESNAAARSLYEKSGFEISGRRKSYYADPVEDAVLYRRNVG